MQFFDQSRIYPTANNFLRGLKPHCIFQVIHPHNENIQIIRLNYQILKV